MPCLQVNVLLASVFISKGKNRRLYQKIFLFYICFEDFVMLVQLVFAHFATSGCKLLAVPFYAQSWPSLLLLPTFVRKVRQKERKPNISKTALLANIFLLNKKIWAQNIVFCHYVLERDKKIARRPTHHLFHYHLKQCSWPSCS